MILIYSLMDVRSHNDELHRDFFRFIDIRGLFFSFTAFLGMATRMRGDLTSSRARVRCFENTSPACRHSRVASCYRSREYLISHVQTVVVYAAIVDSLQQNGSTCHEVGSVDNVTILEQDSTLVRTCTWCLDHDL